MEVTGFLSVETGNVTFLRARDPSILACSRYPMLNEVRMNLIPELESTAQQQIVESDQINVYLRIKKTSEDFTSLYKIDGSTLTCQIPESSNFARNIREGQTFKKSYKFSKIFNPDINQTEIFNFVVKPKILSFINGHNSTLLTYGASGSGKTFTLIGTDDKPGILPRSLEYLFRTLPKLAEYPPVKPLSDGSATLLLQHEQRKEKAFSHALLAGSTLDKTQYMKIYTAMQQRLSNEPIALLVDKPTVSISVWVSFAEIYNEQIYDLLRPDPPRGQQRSKLRLGATNHKTYIKNLTYINVHSGLEAFQILQYGLHNLNYATTSLNSHSSRSHSIFTIKLVQSSSNNDTVISSFNFCDLAGSERSKKTRNVGERLKESNNINNSLSVLGRCISAVRHAQKSTNDNKMAPPYRDSKLTQLFQKALAGEEDIGMIVTISPVSNMFDESLHVLNFSAIASEIIIDRRPKKKNRFSIILEKANSDPNIFSMENEVEILRDKVFNLESELIKSEADSEYAQQYVKDTYEELLVVIKEGHAEELKQLEDKLWYKFNEKLKKLKLQHREELSKAVIIIDSDEEEESTNKKQLKDENEKLKSDFQVLNEECTIQKEKINELQKKLDEEIRNNKILNDKNTELQKTVDDAVKMYKELDKKYQNLHALYIGLELERDNLEEEVAGCRMELTNLLSDKDFSPDYTEDETIAAIDMELMMKDIESKDHALL